LGIIDHLACSVCNYSPALGGEHDKLVRSLEVRLVKAWEPEMSVERLRISVDVLSVVLRVHVLMHALAITHVLSLVRDLNVILADCKVLGWQLNLVSVK